MLFRSPRNTWIFGSRSLMPGVNVTLSSNLYFYEDDQGQGPGQGNLTNLELHEIFGLKNGTRTYVRGISPAALWARVHDWTTMGRRRNLHGVVIDVAHVVIAIGRIFANLHDSSLTSLNVVAEARNIYPDRSGDRTRVRMGRRSYLVSSTWVYAGLQIGRASCRERV